jgi:GNAT superfamily N-acetyltransferase
MGWYHPYFASTCIEEKVCRALIAYDKGVAIGVTVFFEAPVKPLPITVIYYVAVDTKFRRRGVGKALVASVESLFEDSRVFLATTGENNTPSRKLFLALGYKEAYLENLNEKVAETIRKLACCYEDEIVLYKGVSNINIIAQFHENIAIVKRIWKRICLGAWRKLMRL